MTQPRHVQVCLQTTPYYHCIGRCVRRAFLCGSDKLSGRCFEHRREWMREKLAELADVFSIDVCAYAIMSNHYHLVLKLNPDTAKDWGLDQVLARWCTLFNGPLLIQRYRAHEALSDAEVHKVHELADIYKQRLCSLSWFMKCLNEPIARQANSEDQCTGHFWESRFKSQALLDERALLTCMVYVDLNPVRAGMADTPETSDYTSVQQRINQPTQSLKQIIPKLLAFANKLDDEHELPFTLIDYLELVEWSGRAIHPSKKGYISENTPPILTRLSIQPDALIDYLSRKEKGFNKVIGSPQSIRQAALEQSRKFFKGISAAVRLYPKLT